VASRPDLIVDVGLVLVHIPLVEPFAISGGTPTSARNVFVRIELADGTLGYGEAAPFTAVSGETAEETLVAIEGVTSCLKGKRINNWLELCRNVGRALKETPAARAAVEQAIIDTLARSLRTPLLTFLGGGNGRLITDITIPAQDVHHAADSAWRAAARGFRCVKVKVAAGSWEEDVERLAAIRLAAPGLRVVVDANAGFELSEARSFLKTVRARGIPLDLLEQPLASDCLADMADLERSFGIPVCADESVRNVRDALTIVSAGHVSVVNVKIMKFGVVEALDILALARSAGLSCMVGGMIETVAAMTFSACLAATDRQTCRFVDLDTPLFMSPAGISGGMSYERDEIVLDEAASGTGVDLSALF
jgi:L-alanine-DL-glutamate epimerase-like enolase superfamily enzyme